MFQFNRSINQPTMVICAWKWIIMSIENIWIVLLPYEGLDRLLQAVLRSHQPAVTTLHIY